MQRVVPQRRSWYFGSQVARTEQQLRADLRNPRSLTNALERRSKAANGLEAQLLSAFLAAEPGRSSPAPADRDRDVGRVLPISDEELRAEPGQSHDLCRYTTVVPVSDEELRAERFLARIADRLMLDGITWTELVNRLKPFADERGLTPWTRTYCRGHARFRAKQDTYRVKMNDDWVKVCPS
jgi:hypothetical protein